VARSTSKIAQDFVLSWNTIQNTPTHIDLFEIVKAGNWIHLTDRAAIEVSLGADSTTALTRLAIFGCRIGIISIWADSDTTVCISEKVKTNPTKVYLGTIS
jgi:hypothetical protein